ncbi:MAG: prenyltransferase/squalene oxidase repeat-containing protein [Pirellulaceae bacterium]
MTRLQAPEDIFVVCVEHSNSLNRLDRRRFAVAALAAAYALGRQLPALAAQEAAEAPLAPDLMNAHTETAIREGLEYLASRQNAEGSFGADGYRRNVAVVSLAGLAFLANGSSVGRGVYGHKIKRCLEYLLANSDESGFLNVPGSSSHGPMYGHGFATLFLAEVYGMYPEPELRQKLVKAVKLIINTQNEEGGWRYQPERREADISVTICQVMALRAARNAGIYVGNDTIDRCTDYVKRCQNPDGGFAYMLPGGESAFPRTAAGLVALYSAGIYDGEEIRRGLDYLLEHRPQPNASGIDNHFFYGHYYAVQAMWQAGGEMWLSWYPAIRDTLLERRKEDGSWFDQVCPEYGTAMACLILQMPKNYLPIFQR